MLVRKYTGSKQLMLCYAMFHNFSFDVLSHESCPKYHEQQERLRENQA
jgi:uncharacterized membrane protein